MSYRLLLVTILLSFSSLVLAAAEYTESIDDFSSGTVYSLKIPSIKGESAVLFISCRPQNELSVQLAITGTIFPNDLKDGGMIVSTTHKFDKSEEAITSDWFMNIMKYKNSWYTGDKVEFAKSAIESSQLNMRLNKRGDVYRFKLNGTAAHLSRILDYCGK